MSAPIPGTAGRSEEAVDRCVEAAHQSLQEVAGLSHRWRADLLRALAGATEDRGPQLVGEADVETHLGGDRLHHEIARTAFQFRLLADVLDEGSWLGVTIDHPATTPMGSRPDLRKMVVPRGVVGIFGASNFPFASSILGSDTASALAAGCPIVFKANPGHLATSRMSLALLQQVITQCGGPPAMVSMVEGFDEGIALVEHPRLTAVGFTGSRIGGMALYRRCAQRPEPIPFFGELGAANPLIVTPGALAVRGEEIAHGLAAALVQGSGQFCTKPGLSFVPVGSRGDAFVTLLAEDLAGRGNLAMLNPHIAGRFSESLAALVGVPDVRVVLEGRCGEHGASPSLVEADAPTFIAARGSALYEECFGPVGLVVRYDGLDELSALLDGIEPALCCAIFAEPGEAGAHELLQLGRTKAGRVLCDQFPPGAPLSWAMVHGGPFPATTDAGATSMGAASIERWLRPVAFQNVPDSLLPSELQDANPLGLPRRVNGVIEIPD